jgi:hypothetical protein
MSTIESAKAELASSNFGPEDSAVIIDIMERFFAQWDSGGAVWVMIPVLERLMRGLPLSALTGEDDEWHDPMGDGQMFQNVRCSTVFKNAAGKTWDIDGDADVTFPYMPQNRNLSPVVEIGVE